MAFLNRLLRAGETKLVKRLGRIAEHITSLEPELERLSDDELRAKTEEFRRRHDGGAGESLDELLPEAFAVAREAARRVLGQRHFDVQLMGGAALHLGNVAEMRTGEGKTLTSVLPAYLNAVSGKGVHVVTVNDYLAKRDAEWMGRVHRFLGLTVGVILSEMPPEERRVSYAADITYGTNNEFGFDYLRDNMAWSLTDCVQRGHNFGIVDEADSILIDEARTPLIISGPADIQNARWYAEFARIAADMTGIDTTHWAPKERLERAEEIESNDYEVDYRKRTIAITETGVGHVEGQIGIDNIYEPSNTHLVGHMNNAIKAKELFRADKDYIVRDGQVLIVDEFTGRVLHGRRYNEGMHQAIEAKERLEIQPENQTLATITLQNYFRLYDKLSGMTGTAQTEANELFQVYKLHVASIPTNKPMVRDDHADLIYKSESAKFDAVADDIVERHEIGQPVLVGTTSVEKSEYLSRLLKVRQIPHEVLNAKQHEREAAIVALAGHAGAVMVATNMAGRGTDIMLGGNPEFMADQELRGRGLDPVDTPEEYEAAWDDALAKAREEVAAEAEEVKDAGGLYVLGTERHESRRIDNQLRGRSGRQGDPGESRFYLSLGDELMRRFNGQLVESIMNRFNLPDDMPIEAGMVTKAIKSAQTQVEEQNFEIRKNVLKYDEVMNRQRTVIYAERRRVLAGEDVAEQIQHMLEDVVGAYVDGATAEGFSEDWDLEKLWTALRSLYPVGIRWQDLADADPSDPDSELDLSKEALTAAVLADAKRAYADREAQMNELIGPQGGMRELERQVLLQVLDRKWRENLYEMDYLKEGIGLRAMAQRDPAIEYQREGFEMFTAMLDAIKEETVSFLFNIEVRLADGTNGANAQATGDAAVPEQAPAASAPEAAPAPAPAAQSSGVVNAGRAPKSAQARKGRRGGGKHALEQHPEPAAAPLPTALGGAGRGGSTADLQYSGPAEDGTETKRGGNGAAAGAGAGAGNRGAQGSGGGSPARNRPCPCGSGKKYKHCHGSPTGARS